MNNRQKSVCANHSDVIMVLTIKFRNINRGTSGGTTTLTILGNHSEGDHTAGFLDKLDNVVVRELDDGAPVDR